MLFQQGCRSSVGDEYADMTVMHGDVYSKPRDKSSGGRGGEKREEVKGAGVYTELCSTRGNCQSLHYSTRTVHISLWLYSEVPVVCAV